MKIIVASFIFCALSMFANAASVQELIDAANAQKSPGASAAEGFMRGYQDATQRRQDQEFMMEMQRRQNMAEQDRIESLLRARQESIPLSRMPSKFNTGSDLLQACAVAIDAASGTEISPEDRNDLSMLEGIFFGASRTNINFVKGKFKICAPSDGFSFDQAIAISHAYILKNPDRKNDAFASCITFALSDYFSCQEAKR